MPKQAWLLALACELSGACVSRPPSSPFSAAEIERALLPARQLRQRCYLGSATARAAKPAILEFALHIAETGAARAVPTLAQPEDAALIDCARGALDELRFPARGRDRLQLRFELQPDVSLTLPTLVAAPGPL